MRQQQHMLLLYNMCVLRTYTWSTHTRSTYTIYIYPPKTTRTLNTTTPSSPPLPTPQVGRLVRKLHLYEARAYWNENALHRPKKRGGRTIEPHQTVEQRGIQQLNSILALKTNLLAEIQAVADAYQGDDPVLGNAQALFWDLRRYTYTHRLQILKDSQQTVEADRPEHWAKHVDELFSEVCVLSVCVC